MVSLSTLNGIRVLSCFGIVFFHCLTVPLYLFPYDDPVLNKVVNNTFLKYFSTWTGSLFVDIFWVLSAYILVYQLYFKGTKNYSFLILLHTFFISHVSRHTFSQKT